ncbi:molybdenum cofactor biosysynthesis protein [Motilibacter aurantiacus]|uniref:molybdenum cofactor biosysynthesis protein n=1 Tax=Motilibacter aurantiacus TaxID=2714955 RepID=UPI00140A2166|nr:molybdenum cofactor biosysynthesis protein [Motilibacter aurantiacus]NHC44458.1 molybdenum cofactor biosysynthesis protein [Motilibacter aurantiacus]
MELPYSYSVEVLHLLVSPGHAYEGRPADGPALVPTADADEVEVVAGRGIRGDRYFGRPAHVDASVTLIAVEGLEAVAAELGLPALDPLLARRNVVLRGVPVDALVRTPFSLEAGGPPVLFRGGRPANPCAWMDVVHAPGAFRALRRRGGVRARPEASGILRRGPGVLRTPAELG